MLFPFICFVLARRLISIKVVRSRMRSSIRIARLLINPAIVHRVTEKQCDSCTDNRDDFAVCKRAAEMFDYIHPIYVRRSEVCIRAGLSIY